MGWFGKNSGRRDGRDAKDDMMEAKRFGRSRSSAQDQARAPQPDHFVAPASPSITSSYAVPTTREKSREQYIQQTSSRKSNLVEEPEYDDEPEVEKPPPRVVEEYDVEANSKSYSESGGEQESIQETTRQNHLNSLFNGHLMKWKYEAEEGSAFIRVPAFFGSLGLIVTSVLALVLYPEAWTSHSIVMSVCVIIMAIFIAVLDGRFLATNPLSARAHLRNIMTRNFNIFRFLWGRGLLYVSAGILNVAQMWIITLASGGFMIVIGVLALGVGVHASRKFAALRNSLADESFLLLIFTNYDGDGDGYINPNEFALLLSDLGMELDDRYTLKAFNAIDTDHDRRISFDEFGHWWALGYIERGRKRVEDESEDTYRRLD